MADYRVSTEQLTSIADAIRQKGHTTQSLRFPNGFAAAVAALPAGGGSGGVDTTDATATAADILSGKTAYAGGIKLTGSLVPDGFQMLTDTVTFEEETSQLILNDLPFTPQGAVMLHRHGDNGSYYVRNSNTLLFGFGTTENTDNFALSWRSQLTGGSRDVSSNFYVVLNGSALILATDSWLKGPYVYLIWGK